LCPNLGVITVGYISLYRQFPNGEGVPPDGLAACPADWQAGASRVGGSGDVGTAWVVSCAATEELRGGSSRSTSSSRR
jgi:hypothetical protein